MRSIDATLQARIELAQQTLFNNANPQMDVQVTRPRTPITRAGFWQESIVTEGATAICTSVAVRRQVKNPTRAYVAYVTSGGTLVVKWADLSLAWESMVWTTVETIADCVACAIEFDGSFVPAQRGRVEYLTDELPWLFYVTSGGALMAGVLGGSYESLVGANVTAVDAVRGIASKYKDIDQGLLVFYVIAGSLYYRDLIDGVWGDQKSVSIAPADIVSVRAERTFDYRIVLQVTDTSGALHEIFTKMEASGWNSFEFIRLHSVTGSIERIEVSYIDTSNDEFLSVIVEGSVDRRYLYSPVMLEAYNFPVVVYDEETEEQSNNYGLWVRLKFDERVWDTTGNEAAFKVTDEYNISWYAQEIVNQGRILLIRFADFNNASGAVTLSYTPGTVNGDEVALAADTVVFTPTGLVPTYVPPPVPVAIVNLIDQGDET